ncbi:uncharacterized protein LOC141581102 [Saimiri boliviensis]|uniref:uncharacterized protein LOC141581102 n=1 Tax=Saimiri boliviensis TaxID=27679 RepID=UPI003D77D542
MALSLPQIGKTGQQRRAESSCNRLPGEDNKIPTGSGKILGFLKGKKILTKRLCQKWDSNPRLHPETRTPSREGSHLESGALDHSAILTPESEGPLTSSNVCVPGACLPRHSGDAAVGPLLTGCDAAAPAVPRGALEKAAAAAQPGVARALQRPEPRLRAVGCARAPAPGPANAGKRARKAKQTLPPHVPALAGDPPAAATAWEAAAKTLAAARRYRPAYGGSLRRGSRRCPSRGAQRRLREAGGRHAAAAGAGSRAPWALRGPAGRPGPRAAERRSGRAVTSSRPSLRSAAAVSTAHRCERRCGAGARSLLAASFRLPWARARSGARGPTVTWLEFSEALPGRICIPTSGARELALLAALTSASCLPSFSCVYIYIYIYIYIFFFFFFFF